jgi:hypothetical protein
MPDIALFSKTGELLVTDQNCPDDLRERYPALKAAYESSLTADAALEEAKDRLARSVQQVGAAQQYIAVHFPNRGEVGRIADTKHMIAEKRRERFGI